MGTDRNRSLYQIDDRQTPMSFTTGLKALQQGHYQEAVGLLEEYCRDTANANTQNYTEAQMALVRAYHGNGQREEAIALCRQLQHHLNSQTSNWAKGFLQTLSAETSETPKPGAKAARVAQTGIKLAMKGIAGNLAFASTATIALLFGMVFVLCLSLLLIFDSQDPATGLAIAVVITLIFNTVAFFLSPMVMDLTQSWLYGTRWVSLSEIERHSREAAAAIERVCRQKNLKHPRLGIIHDGNPTAFTYGSLPNNARLVVSQGLFTYLDEDEIATVYAHELGHIVH